MVAEPRQYEQPTFFDRPGPAKPKSHRKPKKPPKQKGLARGEFEPVSPPDLTQETAVWLTGQRSIAEQRGKRYVPAGIKHPGKMQPDVCGAIFDTYTEPDWHVVDFMGGQGTTGVEGAERGRHVTIVELVRHWANVAYANALRTMYRGAPGSIRVICGDARNLVALLNGAGADAFVASPPYGEALEKRNGREAGRLERLQALLMDGKEIRGNWHMGAGQRAMMNPNYQADAAIVSPAYGDTLNQHPAATDRAARIARMQAAGIEVRSQDIGGPRSVTTAPQQYDAAVVSPPFGPTQTGRGMALTGINGDGRQPVERGMGVTYDAAIVSPVYGESRIGAPPSGIVFQEGAGLDVSNLPRGYDAALVSPPYGEALPEKGGNIGGQWGYCKQLHSMAAGYSKADAAIVSPPYGPAEGNGGGRGLEAATPKEGEWADYENGTGPSPGWRGYKSRAYVPVNADAVITSPAYGDIRQDGGAHHFGECSAMDNYTSEARTKSRAQRDQSNVGNKKYGTMDKAFALIERLKRGETIPPEEWPAQCYLEDMALIYWHAHGILRQGGLIILVLKDYRRDKRRVNLVGDTMRLLEAVGFVYHDRALALTSKIEDGKVIAKVSPFVRVNARKPEKNGGLVMLPAGEEVLVFRKE